MAEDEEYLIKATVRGFSRVIILWLVEREPISGYKIVKELKRLTAQRFHSGIVYPLLYEMEDRDLIVANEVKKGRRRIKYYSLTEKGRLFVNRLRFLFKLPIRDVLKDLLGEDLQKE